MDISVSLIRRCKKQDREAFDILFERCEQPLYRLCYGYARDRDTALDLMQEVYLKVFRSIQTFDENYIFLPWLKKIAVNTCINYHRDHDQQKELSIENWSADRLNLLESLPSPVSLEDDIITKSITQTIIDSIGELPDIYRLVLTLRYIEDLSYRNIADTLDLPLGTVKSHIFRGRDILKNKLQKAGLLEV
jgi:RNA polymerase sigma-70 factor (ECF subfamily)